MISMQEAICEALVSEGKTLGYTFLEPRGGMPSTTYIWSVFASPYIADRMICGFNTAVRYADIDGLMHLPVFGQFYFCRNNRHYESTPETIAKELEKIVSRVILNVSKKLNLDIDEVQLDCNPYSWGADSTGYKGTGNEVVIKQMKIGGRWIPLDGIEIAQTNVFNESGSHRGKWSDLLVVGIDRMIVLISMAKRFRDRGPCGENGPSFTEMYPAEAYSEFFRDKYTEQQVEGMIAHYCRPIDKPGEIYSSVTRKLCEIECAVKKANTLHEIETQFQEIGKWAQLLEQGYVRGEFSADTRTRLVNLVRGVYTEIAQGIIKEPDIALQIADAEQFHENGRKLIDIIPGLHRIDLRDISPSESVDVSEVKLPMSLENALRNYVREEANTENGTSQDSLTVKIKRHMLKRLWREDSKLSEARVERMTLIGGGNNAMRMERMSAMVELLPLYQFSNQEKLRIKEGLHAIAQAEASLIVRQHPSFKSAVALAFDKGTPPLPIEIYDTHNLDVLNNINFSTNGKIATAVIVLDAIDRSIRAMREYGKASGFDQDRLKARMSRNIAIDASWRIPLSKETLDALIKKNVEMQEISTEWGSDIPEFFHKRKVAVPDYS